MLRIPFCLMMLGSPSYGTNYGIYDVDKNSKLIMIEIDNCRFIVPKEKQSDMCYIIKKVNQSCGLDLDEKDCK